MQTSHEFFKGKTVRLVVGTSAGGAQDEWARFLAPHLGRNIPGGPDIVVQNMPGAGTVIAANYIYNIAKPDGLTLGLVNPAIYIDQLHRSEGSEVRLARNFPGSAPRNGSTRFCLYVQTSRKRPWMSFARLQRRHGVQPRGVPALVIFYRSCLRRGSGLKVQMVVGYGGGGDMNLAMEKGEVQCRAGTVSAYVGREPTRTWAANGFTRALVQSGTKRYSKLPDVPTLYELMETYKTPDATRRVAKVLLSSGDLGRPFFGPPGMAADRLKILREAFTKTMNDEALLAEAKKKQWDLDPMNGEELETLAKEIMVQPPEVIERVKKILGN